MTVDSIFGLLGQLVAAGGGGAVVAFALFRFFGESWIESELARRLEIAKAEISLLAARRMKLPDREYLVFPEVWAKLNKAVSSLGRVIISFREMPDLNRMSEADLSGWLDRSDLSDDERRFLAAATDKSIAYGRVLDWRALIEARAAFVDFHTYLQSNRIFLSPDLKERFDRIGQLIPESWIAKKMDWDGHSQTAGESFLTKAWDKYEKQVKPLMLEIEKLVQSRLFPEGSHTESMRSRVER